MNKYGLIGKNIFYSLSPKLHNLIAFYNNYEISYELIDILEDDLLKYLNHLKQGKFQGFNVTIPYKETIIKHLDKITEKALKIGAVNTVYLDESNNIVGDNTDYFGFKKLLENNDILTNIKKVYILGTGGAAKTVYHVLNDKNIEVVAVSRTKTQAYPFKKIITYEEFSQIKEIELLINCTPVGTKDCKKMAINDVGQIFNKIVDLIYNPLLTELMKLSKCSYNGLEMLIYQAIESQKIFLKRTVKDDDVFIKLIKEELVNEFIR